MNENEDRGVHAFCPHRWTIRGQSCQGMIDNYNELMELWEWSLENVKETDMIARIRGVMVYMKQFKFLFGCLLGKMILIQTDNLSRTLQDSKCTAVEGQDVASNTVKTLRLIRNDSSFEGFWKLVQSEKERLEVDDPALPRKKRRQTRIDDHFYSDTTYNPPTVEEMYRKIYYEAIDYAISTITDRFDQPDYEVYRNMQQVFMNALNGKPFSKEIDEVMKTFGDDLNKIELEAQLQNLRCYSEEPVVNVHELVSFLQNLSQSQKRFMPQVVILSKLLLVMPATNAVSERSFSALKRVKTYLRSTTTNKRLNHLMLLHVHKDRTDTIDINNVGNEFVFKDNRKQIFGHFG